MLQGLLWQSFIYSVFPRSQMGIFKISNIKSIDPYQYRVSLGWTKNEMSEGIENTMIYTTLRIVIKAR